MTEVVIAGIGQMPVGEHWDLSLRELAFGAILAAQEDAPGLEPQALFVANMLAPQLSHQAHIGALVADFAGLTGIEAVTIEAGGASGGAALRAGYMAVASEQVDVALVVGAEKITEKSSSEQEDAMATGLDSDYESVQGMTLSAQAALLMQRYQYEFSPPGSAFAGFPIIAHANSVANPNAMFHKAIRPEMYERAALVCDPLNMLDIAPWADGSAALILTRSALLPPEYPHKLVRISGSSYVSDTLALHDRRDPLAFSAAGLSVERACSKAHITPLQVDLFELHDAYSIYATLSLEAAGYAQRGEGWKLAQDGNSPAVVSLQGSLPIATLGGLKARGNPGGATGLYQAVEAVLQLRGRAGDNQVIDARRALIQSLSGPASAAATHVLEVLD